MGESNDTKEEAEENILASKAKGSLKASVVLLLLIGLAMLVTLYSDFDLNMVFILVGIIAALILPISGLVGLIRSLRYMNRFPNGEKGTAAGFHLLILIAGLSLCVFFFNQISSFRWPG